MDINPLQQSGQTISPYKMATGTSRAENEFSPLISHLQGLVDPSDLNSHPISTSSRDSPPVTTEGDVFSFHQCIGWHATPPNRENVESVQQFVANQPVLATPKHFVPENNFQNQSGTNHSARGRPRLDILNSQCPPKSGMTPAGSTPGMSVSERNLPNQQSHLSRPPSLHPSEGYMQDRTGGASPPNRSTPQRQFSNATYSHRFMDTQGNPNYRTPTYMNLHEAADPPRLRTQSSNGSSRDGTVDSGTTTPLTEPELPWRHLIHTCCEVGHVGVVEELIEAGLDINKRDSAGNTPIHVAADFGHEEVMTYLLSKGCDLNAVNNGGWTAAHLASVKGHRGCLRILLKANASPWARLSISE